MTAPLLLRRLAPAPYFHPLVLLFQIPPQGDVIKTTMVRTMVRIYANWEITVTKCHVFEGCVLLGVLK